MTYALYTNCPKCGAAVFVNPSTCHKDHEPEHYTAACQKEHKYDFTVEDIRLREISAEELRQKLCVTTISWV
jgi:hypothetical protein